MDHSIHNSCFKSLSVPFEVFLLPVTEFQGGFTSGGMSWAAAITLLIVLSRWAVCLTVPFVVTFPFLLPKNSSLFVLEEVVWSHLSKVVIKLEHQKVKNWKYRILAWNWARKCVLLRGPEGFLICQICDDLCHPNDTEKSCKCSVYLFFICK